MPGGNGFVEESGLPRLYRETPLNSIWEGSGNVIALDVLRILAKTPQALDAFLAEVDLAAGGNPRLDEHVAKLRVNLGDRDDLETRARRITGDLALALQGSLVVSARAGRGGRRLLRVEARRSRRPGLRHAPTEQEPGGHHRPPRPAARLTRGSPAVPGARHPADSSP